MKNTVKKILALVFAVVMVCSLAVPALAADETIGVTVTVIDYNGNVASEYVTVKATKANVKAVVDAFNDEVADAYEVKFNTDGIAKSVGGNDSADVENVFKTGYWAVALNGKLVAEDAKTVAVEEDDRVVVYWNDPTFDTKLVQFDSSMIDKGVLYFYYYDAEGVQKPLADLKVVMYANAGLVPDEIDNFGTNIELMSDKITGKDYFVTSEDGQIWISPEYLDETNTNNAEINIYIDSVTTTTLKAIKETNENYTKTEREYYNANLSRNIEAGDVEGRTIDVANLYNTADATGDMTMVYVLVAAAAVITLAAVVVMKKKAVKAN